MHTVTHPVDNNNNTNKNNKPGYDNATDNNNLQQKQQCGMSIVACRSRSVDRETGRTHT